MLKRKLSLEQTWQKCMKMWKEMIEKHWERGMSGGILKAIYFENHPKMDIPSHKCFFCDYGERHSDYECDECDECPGRFINKGFNCCSTSYHYRHKPKAFYRKLLELDKKRKKS